MHERVRARVLGAVLVLSLCALAVDGADEKTKVPRDIGLIERAERGLVQLDVTVRGPWEEIRDLGPEDFRLVVAGQPIEHLLVDRLCPEPAEPGSPAPAAVTASEPAVAVRPRTSFLLYFDQHQLTLGGRQNAIDLARRMVPRLLRDGNRGAIVSSGKKLDTLADLTEDPERLLAALDRLEGDREQWELYPQQEETRIRDVLDTAQVAGVGMACSAARTYYREESIHTDKALRIFALTLGQLAGLDPPKVVFYFADITRRDAGAHYLSYVGGCAAAGGGDDGQPDAGDFGATFAIDHVIEQAAAQGTRVYTIRAEGLVAPSDTMRREGLGPSATTNLQRYSQAGDSLVGLALETGGRSFIHGELAPKILEAVADDLGCMYLISFDPGGLPEDQLLRVALTPSRPKFKAFTRGQMMLQSEDARRTSRLLSAFALPKNVQTDMPLVGTLVPTGFERGRYKALLQVRTAGVPLPQSTWDIGASLLTAGEVKSEASTRVSLDRANVPIVFETEMSFRPGPFELVLVAQEESSEQVGTQRVEGAWPVRDDGPALTPISILQPVDALFVRDGQSRPNGALATAEADTLRTDRPTALIGMVCRGPGNSERFRLERVLLGETETRFENLELELGEEPCAQFRDVIQANTLTPGGFTYRAVLAQGNVQVASAERSFHAEAPPTATAATAGSAP